MGEMEKEEEKEEDMEKVAVEEEKIQENVKTVCDEKQIFMDVQTMKEQIKRQSKQILEQNKKIVELKKHKCKEGYTNKIKEIMSASNKPLKETEPQKEKAQPKAKRRQVLECDIREEEFDLQEELEKHIDQDHRTKGQYNCNDCDMQAYNGGRGLVHHLGFSKL